MRSTPPLLFASLALAAPLPAAEFAGGHMFVTSAGDARVYEFGDDGALVRTIGPGAGLFDPRGLAFGPDGHLYVSSFSGNTVFVIDADGELVRTIGDSAVLSGASLLTFGADGRLHVCSRNTQSLVIFDWNGVVVDEIQGTSISDTFDVTIGNNGHIYVSGGKVLTEYDPTGVQVRNRILNIFESDAYGGIAFGPSGVLYAALDDPDGEEVVRLGDALAVKGATANAFNDLTTPRGVAFGPNGNLFVVDLGIVKEFDPAPGGDKIQDHTVGSGLANPYAVAFSPYSFSATITGTLERPGQPSLKVKEKNARLQVFPGAVESTLLWVDMPTKNDDLASVFGAEPTVFRGFESAVSPDASTRTVQCLQVPSASMERGTASMHLVLKGKKQTKGGVTSGVTSTSGVLLRASSNAVFTGKVSAKKALK